MLIINASKKRGRKMRPFRQALEITKQMKIINECLLFNYAGKTKEEITANVKRKESANKKLESIRNGK